MKKFIIYFLILVNSGFLQAQNVGIGTNSPSARLEVVGTTSSASGNVLMLRNSNADTLLRMNNDGKMGIGYNGSYGRTLNIGGNGINFFDENNEFSGSIYPTNSNALWIRSDDKMLILQPYAQNVGIGVTNPTSKLHVNGDIRGTGVIEGNGISSTGILFVNQTSLLQGAVTGFSSAQFTGNIGSNTGITINNSSAILQMQSGGNNKGFVQLSGDNFRFGTNSGNSNGNVVLRMDGTDMIEFQKTGSGGTFMQMNLNGTSTGVLQTTSTGNVSLTAVNANAQVQLGGEVFINNTTNTTGIGTSSPGERLHVNGNMIVNGSAVIDDGRITGTATGSAYNLLPVCYGRVNENGTKAGGTLNFTVSKTSLGSYEIVSSQITSSSIIMVNAWGANAWCYGKGNYVSANTMRVGIVDILNTDVRDCAFHFIIYNP